MYESAERRFVGRYLLPDIPVVELGSALGGISSQIGRRLKSGQRLICVEANPHLMDLLGKNLKRNASHPKVSVIHGAISSHTGTVQLALSKSVPASKLRGLGGGSDFSEVPSLRLSDVLVHEGIGDCQLAMDIEGAESCVFFEDSAALANCRRAIVELHETRHNGRDVAVETLFDALTTLGFVQRDRCGAVLVMDRAETSRPARAARTAHADFGYRYQRRPASRPSNGGVAAGGPFRESVRLGIECSARVMRNGAGALAHGPRY